ncbi:MAG: ABC transporter ATP-binding protein [Opitutaceae bacterium]|jgi:spermidine/putrescine transport system ATP-binding protein|nr:ABC transporter ATP-binding protein [Opitutaceae bacterium]
MIDIRGITKRFGEITAVDNVHLHIEAGEFITLLGPSGCGKTTLLRVISGFEPPDAGTIHLAGQDVTHHPPYRRSVNQVFQSYALFPHMTVRQNIAFGLRMKKTPAAETAARVDEAIDLVALRGYEHRRPHQLSGGQRQRVALARALVPNPHVLLLDEPLSALDAKLRRQMQLELKRIQKRLGVTFVFVTHDQEEALTMSDRIAVINQGRIEQIGTPGEVYHHPRTAFVADFIGEANLVPATLASRNGASTCVVRLDGGLLLTLKAGQWPDGLRRAHLAIRPEKILISKTLIQEENVFEARVTGEVFQGVIDRLSLECDAGGIRLMAVVANESAIMEAIHEGDRVWCGLHSDDVVVVP